jgi:hypothetical protein
MSEYGSPEHKAEWLDINEKYYGSPEEAEEAWLTILKLEANPPQSPSFFLRQDVSYTSPIDGRVISSMAQRKDDLARSGCIEYDPEMKTDYNRRIEREEKQLEAKMEESVNAQIANMPARKREQLNSELSSGVEIATERITA